MSTRPLAHQVMPGADGAESATADEGGVRPRDSLFHWCGTVDALRQTDDRAGRQSLLEAYFGAVAEESIAAAARYFLGTFFSRAAAGIACIPGPVVIDAMHELASINIEEMRARCETLGDVGCVAGELFAGRLPSGVSISEVADWGSELAEATEAAEQQALVRDMLARLSSLEARYLVNLIMGELSTGLTEGDVEEALARTFSQPLAAVRSANESRHDIGEVAELARRRAIA